MTLTEKTIYGLHKKYSRGEKEEELLELIWGHSKIVSEISDLIADNLEKEWGIKTNRELIKQGALIHDIGAYACYETVKKNVEPYVRHGEVGYEILNKEGFPRDVARFALVHMGVGIVKENIEMYSLPLKDIDYIPITTEEEIMAFADNFHSKGVPKFIDFESAKNNLIRHYEFSKIIFERFEKKFGVPDLNKLEEKYKDWHTKMRKIVSEI